MTFFSTCMRTSSAIGKSEAIWKWEMDGDRMPVSVGNYVMRYQCLSFNFASYAGVLPSPLGQNSVYKLV